jgi:hypothetical protein
VHLDGGIRASRCRQGVRQVAEQIIIDLDAISSAALRVLTSNGTSVDDAVRAAVIEAAERYPEPPAHDRSDRRRGETYAEWIARQVAAAPPFSDHQVRVLTAAFVQGRNSSSTEHQVEADEDTTGGDRRRA